MTTKFEYQHIARRSLDACESCLKDNIQEKAAFMAYHAFESSGSALSEHLNFPVGPNVSHPKKINHFKNAAKRLRNEKPVATLAITISSLRNDFLYPIENPSNGKVQIPENVISLSQAKTLKKRVTGIVKWVDKQL